MIYLFRTKAEGKVNRLRPLPFQTDESGKPLITELNTQANAEMRRNYPIGTIFASEHVELRTGTAQPFYSATDIYPVSVRPNDLLSTDDVPTTEMYDTYNKYMQAHGKEIEETDVNDKSTKPEDSAKPLSMLQKMKNNPLYEKPTVDKDGFWVSDDVWWDLMTNIKDNINTMFIGPQGSGKTEIVRLACAKLGIPLHIYDMGSMYDPMSQLMGVHRISKNGTSVFEYANFVKDVQTECVILLDELSRMNPDSANLLLPCLDFRREVAVEMAGESDKRRIPIHPKCMFIATANIGAEFTGVKELDPALKDRFYLEEMQYMPVEEEVNMLMKRFRIGKTDACNIVNVADKVRMLVEREELDTRLSTRETMMAARKIHQGFTAKEAMEKVYLPLYSGTKAEGERAVVYNIILGR